MLPRCFPNECGGIAAIQGIDRVFPCPSDVERDWLPCAVQYEKNNRVIRILESYILQAVFAERIGFNAARAGLKNTSFVEGSLDSVDGQFDLVFGIFFLHHLPDAVLAEAPARIAQLLAPDSTVFALQIPALDSGRRPIAVDAPFGERIKARYDSGRRLNAEREASSPMRTGLAVTSPLAYGKDVFSRLLREYGSNPMD